MLVAGKQACTGHRDYRDIPGGPRSGWAGGPARYVFCF